MRTQMPELISERLAGKASLWLGPANEGNGIAIARLETLVYTLRVVGFAPNLIEQVLAEAANDAGVNTNDALARFLPDGSSVSTTRKRDASRTADQS